MNRLLYPVLFLLFIACSAETLAPRFQKVSNVLVKEMNIKNVTIESDLVYYNPNRISGKVKSFDVDVIVNDINVGKLKQKKEIEILAKQDFVVPSTISFPPREIFKSDNFFKSALQVFANEKADVQYVGSMTVTVANLDFEVPVKYQEEISLKKSK